MPSQGPCGELVPGVLRGEDGASAELSIRAAAMRRVKSSTGSLEHPPWSGPSSGAGGGSSCKILQNRVEGPSVHALSCVC